MDNLARLFESLSGYEIFYAVMAIFILYFTFARFSPKKTQSGTGEYKKEEALSVKEKYEELFPIQSFYFKDTLFTRGAKVRLSTKNDKTLCGTLIGKNEKNVICIITQKHILVQEFNKIADLVIDTEGSCEEA